MSVRRTVPGTVILALLAGGCTVSAPSPSYPAPEPTPTVVPGADVPRLPPGLTWFNDLDGMDARGWQVRWL